MNTAKVSSAIARICSVLLIAVLVQPACATTIDGFQVSITTKLTQLPKKPVLSVPKSTTGIVLAFTGSQYPAVSGLCAVDPYAPTALFGSTPFLSIQTNSSATFSYPAPKRTFSLVWGTPDFHNFISFYDAAGHLIGTLSGADFQAAYGFSNANRPNPVGLVDRTTIVSPQPFTKVVLSDTTACGFDFSNVSAKT